MSENECGTLLIETEKGNVALICLLIEGCFYEIIIGIGGKLKLWVFLAIKGCLQDEKEDPKAFPFAVYS